VWTARSRRKGAGGWGWLEGVYEGRRARHWGTWICGVNFSLLVTLDTSELADKVCSFWLLGHVSMGEGCTMLMIGDQLA